MSATEARTEPARAAGPIPWHAMTVEEVGRELSMEAATGLEPAEVERRRAR